MTQHAAHGNKNSKNFSRSPERPGEVNGFTLGSHGEYFEDRTSTKNVQFPYGTYWGHFCLGLIYTRTDLAAVSIASAVDDSARSEDAGETLEEMAIFAVEELGSQSETAPAEKRHSVKTLREITSVMKELQFFACEKWELASDQAGSGNTANIGGIRNIDDILNGRGVFHLLGEDMFDEYWTNYGKITDPVSGKRITDLRNYLAFKGLDSSKAFYRSQRRQKKLFASFVNPQGQRTLR